MEDRLRNIGAELDAAKQVLADMRTAPKGTYEKIDVSEQAERVRMLQSEFNKTANSIDKLNEKLNKPAIRFPTRKRRRLNYHDKSMDDPKVLDCATQPKRRQIP